MKKMEVFVFVGLGLGYRYVSEDAVHIIVVGCFIILIAV